MTCIGARGQRPGAVLTVTGTWLLTHFPKEQGAFGLNKLLLILRANSQVRNGWDHEIPTKQTQVTWVNPEGVSKPTFRFPRAVFICQLFVLDRLCSTFSVWSIYRSIDRSIYLSIYTLHDAWALTDTLLIDKNGDIQESIWNSYCAW